MLKKLFFLLCLLSNLQAQDYIQESSRQIPLAYDVDVVVIGGSSIGVAAAVAAAKNGHKVFLAARRPYLGNNLCGTGYSWLAPGETSAHPLAQALYFNSNQDAIKALPFTYATNLKSSGKHKDTGEMLSDGKSASAISESVEYSGDVVISMDLGSVQLLDQIELVSYYRKGDYSAESVSVKVSRDGKLWTKIPKLGELKNTKREHFLSRLSVPVKAHYVKVVVKKSPQVKRLLIGEVILGKTQKPASSSFILPAPLHIKTELDKALIAAGVEFLYGCFATDVIVDENGKAAGIVMANRSGRQAVKAKVIIDATDHAWFARSLETDLTKKAESEKTFKRIVIGGKEQAGARILPVSSKHNKKEYKLAEYTFKRKVDGSYASLMQVEQELKSLSWQQGQVWATESLVVSPVQKIISKKAGLKIHSLKDLSLELFQLNNHGNVIVAGPAAGIPSNFSELLKRPHHSIEFGTWVGKQASLMAKTIVKSSQVAVKVKQGKGKNVGQVKEFLNGLRGEMSTAKSFVLSPQRDLKVLGRFDTVVIGGGTGGAPAAIAAARNGAETLLVEFHHGLGGIGTMGLIGRYWYGNRVGFTKEVDEINDKRGWDSETKKEWLRKAYVEAGGTLWTGSIGSGALVEDGHVKGVIVTTPEGRGVVLCKTVIDSTGNCDIAIAAGAKYEFVNKDEFGMQGTGLSPLTPENSYTNSDWTFIDDMDMLDRKRAHVVAKLKFKGSWDMAQHIDTRERRHIIGDYYLSPIDIARGKTYPDNIVLSQSNWDSHGYSNHLLFKFWFPGRRDVIKSYVPYRCLLPKGLEGILVTGVGISAHRDSFAIIRMQPDVQNHGYAAGIASAIALQEEKPVRYISIRNLQKKLVKKGILDIAAAGNEETQEAGAKLVSAAVQNLAENYDGVWNILDAPRELSQAILLEALNDPKKSLKAAHILSYFGDDSGKEVLLKYLEESSWDNGWSMMGMGNHGSGYSSLDSIILGLAEADVKAAVPLIIEKMNQLKDESNFSHIRVCAMALEKLKTNVAGPALAQFLLKKEMRGHEILNYNDLVQKTPASSKDTIERRGSLRELILARALYNCGDVNGLGQKILETYANDLRGVYAIHARKVLGVK